jgi:predicted RNA binding protein YcfA (HicA-like mRNA interferase family)
MPRKVRQFKQELRERGFDWRPGKGRHQVWSHAQVTFQIVIARQDGDDTPSYLEKQLKQAVVQLEAFPPEDE